MAGQNTANFFPTFFPQKVVARIVASVVQIVARIVAGFGIKLTSDSCGQDAAMLFEKAGAFEKAAEIHINTKNFAQASPDRGFNCWLSV